MYKFNYFNKLYFYRLKDEDNPSGDEDCDTNSAHDSRKEDEEVQAQTFI